MSDICGDNRFEIIAEAKSDLLEATNIKGSPEEMAVLDSFLFRCWQMGWLKKYELNDFEWCTDCKEYDQENHCCHRWTKVIRQTVEEMKNRWKWIPVTEALPNNEEYDWVLGQIRETDSGYLWIPRQVEYREIKDDWYEDSIGWLKENPDHAFEVIAWMPLPERYRGEK